MLRSVELLEKDGKTIVRIINDGHISDRKFDHADYARSWAEGQRIRLGLPMKPHSYPEARTGT
ncbi:hypothetical protein NOI24_16245 [Neorhizobium galegae]|uniref:hypothetical protein n=1 Tax=Neorhizobium galegae TaxID=399 RepID=UPI002101E191|nr:hypothetical protein [Neorhizobium galegae]MCQ1772861.1 hypothetical protein [Neorhizobium galegae]MCQ1799192.1 hypothetical protein [Neorhizobium galegae]